MALPTLNNDHLYEALKTVAVVLKQAELPFALAGGFAAWARGGPEPDHDVDFAIAADDVERVKDALEEAGLRVEQPPEDWLFKAYLGEAMVDLIHHFGALTLDRELLDECDQVEVLSVCMPVLTATQVVWSRMRALEEHTADFGAELPTLRALREQVDWAEVERMIEGNDFADALLYLARRLRVVPDRKTG